MSLERIVDKIIREAMENGDFEGLEGRNAPIDLTTYFQAPEHLRAGFSIIKNANVLPEEMELLRSIQALKDELAQCPDEGAQAKIKRSIADKMLRYNLFVESRRRTSSP